MYSLLLQHIQDKPTITQIADSGANSGMSTAILITLGLILTAIVTQAGIFIFRSVIAKPHERVEQYEAAEMKAIRDGFAAEIKAVRETITEIKTSRRDDTADYKTWRDLITKQITVLEYQQKALNDFLTEMRSELKSMKSDVQATREAITRVETTMDQTLIKYTR